MTRMTSVLASVAVLLGLFTSALAVAAPSTDCRDLAQRFGNKAINLSVSELARLRTCVSDELYSRTEVSRPPAPMSPPPRPIAITPSPLPPLEK